MNPYVYNNPQVAASPSAWQKVKSIFSVSVSPIMVAGILALSAGSVFAMSFGVSQTNLDLGPIMLPPIHVLPGKVLGASTSQLIINDSSLEAVNPSAQLSAQPLRVDPTMGRWDYNVSYSVASSTGSGALTIGNYVIANNLSASGIQETGAILKPNTTYTVTFWNVDQGGNRQSLASIQLLTGAPKPLAGNSPVAPACVSSQIPTSTPPAPQICIKKDD